MHPLLSLSRSRSFELELSEADYVKVMEKLTEYKQAVLSGNIQVAETLLLELKAVMMEYDSLPPVCAETQNALAERVFAREVYEQSVVLAIISSNKEAFQKYLSALRPYYTGFQPEVSESENKYTILGLNLLYLIVENRLADYHSELEFLTEEQKNHAAIKFCTQLEQKLMVGAYDEVMAAAEKPPAELYSFFLGSLLETVRMNIAECAELAYVSLTPASAKEVLMFQSVAEASSFISRNCPGWTLQGDKYLLKPTTEKVFRAEDISSHTLISQSLAYATELDRIV